MTVVFKLLALIIIVFASLMACLSLNDIHSSSQTFKNTPLDDYKDKTLRNALDTVRRRRQEYPFAHIHGPYGLPIQASEYYKRLLPFVKKEDEEAIEVPIGYNQIQSNYMEESERPSINDLFSTALAIKLSQILGPNDEKEPNDGLRVLKGINMKRKRSASKHSNNNRPDSMTNKNNDFKITKQHVEELIKHRNGFSKTKAKRKSTRRILRDHFKIQENNGAVIDRNTKHTAANNLHNSKAEEASHSYSSSKPLNSQTIADKNIKPTKIKKSITKRKVTTPPMQMIDKSSAHNGSKIKTNEVNITDNKVMSELSDILADDNNKQNLDTKPIENNKSYKDKDNDQQPVHQTKQKLTLVNKKNKRSNADSIGEDINNNESDNELIYPVVNKIEEENSALSVENQWPTTKEDFDEWIRKEYYKNIAKTLATMRRKRSESVDLFTDDFGSNVNNDINLNEDSFSENLIAIDDSDDKTENSEDEPNNNDSKYLEKLVDESDDDYVIPTQDDDDSSEIDIDESFTLSESDPKSKNYKSKRSVSSYFGEIGDNVETNDVSIDSERFNRLNNKLQVIEDELINEALDLIRESAEKGSQTEAQTDKIENRLDAAYDIEDMRLSLDNLHKTVVKINHEKSGDDNDQELDNEVSTPVTAINQVYVEKKKDLEYLADSNQYCFAVEMLSSDCPSVADLVPNGKVKDSFIEACNWHQVCYTCGEVYGLLSGECDAGFLEASRLACDGSPSCETFARLILSPLRQSRVFYKSDVPQACYHFQCIRNFLFDTQEKRR